MPRNAKLYILPAAVFATLLLTLSWLWAPMQNARAMVQLLHAYSEGFSYVGIDPDTYLPVPASEEARQSVESALAALAPQPESATAPDRARASLLAAAEQWDASLAVFDSVDQVDLLANPVLALTRAAVLEQATDAATDAADAQRLRAEQGLAWAQALGDIQTVLRIGTARQAMDKPAAATHLYRRATLAYPQYRDPWYYLARMEAQAGQPQQAIDLLEQGIAATQTTGRIGQSNLHYLIARIRNYTPELFDPQAVLDGYKRAVELQDFGSQAGDESDTHFQLGHIDYAAQNWAAALAQYEQAAALDPLGYNPQLTIAASLWQLGRHEEAFQQLENAIRAYPQNKTAYQWLADLHRHAGEDERARQSLRRLLAVDPSDAEAQAAVIDLNLLPAYVPGL